MLLRSPAPRLLLVCAMALLFRLACVAVVNYDLWENDADWYRGAAQTLVEHGVYANPLYPGSLAPTTYRAPLYPLVIAASYRVFGITDWPVRALQFLLSFIIPLLLYAAVRKINPRLAFFVLLVTLFSPFDAFYTGTLMSETLTAFFLVAVFTIPFLGSTQWKWVAAGLALGLAAITRDIYLGLLPLVMVWSVIEVPLHGRKRRAGLVLLGAALAIIPCTARNYRATGEFILISKGSLGANLWNGAYQHGISMSAPAVHGEEAQLAAKADASGERTQDDIYLSLVRRRWTQAPLQVLSAWLSRVPWLWIYPRTLFYFRPALLQYGSLGWQAAKGTLFLLNLSLFVLAIAGVVFARRQGALLWFAAPLLYTAFAFLPFHIEVRYSQPVYDFLLLFAAVTLHRWFGAGKVAAQPVEVEVPAKLPSVSVSAEEKQARAGK